ncbi:MAG: primosomal protein N' [Myxococcota bacterium]|jgi:primosomal protein N' (replication factor Y)|nr:primosomal protein N' [Myxococcota bacterium]
MPAVFVDVAVDVPLPRLFTYVCPDGWLARAELGCLVQVPWRKSSRIGVVMKRHQTAPSEFTPRAVLSLLDTQPVLDVARCELARFMASYYRAPIGEVVKLMLPPSVEDFRLHLRAHPKPEPSPDLNTALGEKSARVLQLLHEERCTRPHSWSAFRQLLALDDAELSRLLELGIVLPELHAPSAEPKADALLISLTDAAFPKRLGPQQKAILDYLGTQGETPLSCLRETLDANPATLRRLEALGLLRQRIAPPKDPFLDSELPDRQAPTLNPAQEAAWQAAIAAEGFKSFLLHGVTGSGKTEVYLRIIETELRQNRGALVLLPEIALTPQVSALFRAAFGDAVAILHSGVSVAERNRAWLGIHRGQFRIAIGARSALFAPVRDLGVIVVDEEHDGSFKQSESPRYHARDMALMRAKLSNCRVILGSATPSLESYQLAATGKLSLLSLPERIASRPMPSVELVDMTEELRFAAEDDPLAPKPILSRPLLAALAQTLERQEQAIVLLNRRGHSTFVQCGYCGYVASCDACSVSLTYHRHGNLLQCHYCDHREPLPELCPRCLRPELELFGLGTQQLVEHLSEALPRCRIDRLDRDMARGSHLQKVLERFRQGQLDVLVGTQMVAKGHDIHNVTLVGVIAADASLNLPDFRAAERTFQLLTQVAGRAGRGLLPGKVVIQTMNPAHAALHAAQAHSFEDFVKGELPLRQALGYPPFGSLVCIRTEAVDAPTAEHYLRLVAQRFRASPKPGIQVLGPAPSPLGRLRGRARFQLLIKGRQRSPLHALLNEVLNDLQRQHPCPHGVRLVVDIDPLELL